MRHTTRNGEQYYDEQDDYRHFQSNHVSCLLIIISGAAILVFGIAALFAWVL